MISSLDTGFLRWILRGICMDYSCDARSGLK